MAARLFRLTDVAARSGRVAAVLPSIAPSSAQNRSRFAARPGKNEISYSRRERYKRVSPQPPNKKPRHSFEPGVFRLVYGVAALRAAVMNELAVPATTAFLGDAIRRWTRHWATHRQVCGWTG
jgi:hypothetical protein